MQARHKVSQEGKQLQVLYASLIDWISDTRSQGYTDLQSSVKCLDHRGIVLVLDEVCSQAKVVRGCVMHSNAKRAKQRTTQLMRSACIQPCPYGEFSHCMLLLCGRATLFIH